MKILLVYPQYSDQVSSLGRLLKNKIPPLGLLYIAAALEKAGHEVKIIDNETEEMPLEELGRLAKDWQPEIIGISATTVTFKKARETARHFKSILPQVPIIFGGPHLASFPKISLEFPEIDFVVVGEGEITIVELVSALTSQQNQGLENIKGLAFKKDDQIIQNPLRPEVANLDELPNPAWHLIDLKKYHDVMSKKKRLATMMSSRGCPYNCLWCDPEGRFGKMFRARSANNILDEIDYLYQKGIREIIFYDDTFTVNRDRIVDFCHKLIAKKLDLVWECRTRVNLVDDDLLRLMKKAGCYRIRFGVESGNDEILRFIRKNITKEQVRNAFNWSHKNHIETFAYFMLGLPQETEKTVEETIDFSLEIKPDFVMYSPTQVFNKSNDLFKWASERGYIAPDYWQRIARGEDLDMFPILNTPQLPKEKVIAYTKKAYKRFYFRPAFIFKAITKINSIKKLIDYPLIALGMFSGSFKG